MANTYTWTGASSNDWTNSLNWNLDTGFPGTASTDIAVINAASATPTISATDGSITLGNVTIDSTGSATVDVTGIGAGLILDGGTSVSIGGTGQNLLEALNGGTISQNGSSAGFGIGANAGATGTLIVSGTSSALDFSSTSKGITAGGAGVGVITVSNDGSIQMSGTGGLVLGTLASGSGTVTIETGGIINMGSSSGVIGVGVSGTVTSTLDIESNSTLENFGASGIGVGQSANALGIIIVNGSGALLNLGSTTTGAGIGQSGTGSLLVEGGGAVTLQAGGMGLGDNNGGVGGVTVTGTGSTLIAQGANGGIGVGKAGTGVLTVNAGGGVSLTSALSIGSFGTSSSSGTATVGGTGGLSGGSVTADAIDVGADFSGSGGTGVLNILGSGTVTDTASSLGVVVGMGSGASGSVTINGGSLLANNNIVEVGATSGTGNLLVENSGTMSFSNGFAIGGEGTGVATIETGGQVSDTGSFPLDIGTGTGGSGSLVINGGTFLDSSATMLIGGSSATGAATVEGTGGSLSVGNGFTLGSAGTGTLDVEGGAVTDTGSLNTNIGSSSGSGVLIINGGSLTDTTNGFFVGNTTASGTVQVNGGVLTTGTNTGGSPPFSDINATGGGIASVLVDDTGVWNSDGNLIVGDTGSGTLTISDGGTVDASATSVDVGNTVGGTGVLSISGTGSSESELEADTLSIGGINGTGDVTVGAFGLVTVSNVLMNASASLTMAGGDLFSSTTINSPGQISGFGAIAAAVSNAATITASGGILNIAGGIAGVGSDAIDAGSTLEADGIADSQSINFANGVTNSALQLDALLAANETFQLTNWQQGDELIINNGSNVTGVSWLNPGSNIGTLQVVTNSTTYDFTGVTAADAGLTPVFMHSGNTITLVSCFARGTLIETSRGPVAVEELAEGDIAVTADGEREPVIWIGHRTIDCARHPNPEAVWPVRVAAGAFGPGLPERNLYLSPDHAVFVDGALVPVKLLLNGTSITQMKRDSVTYYHVELPDHSIILAEQLPVESYLDTGDRAQFAGGPVIALYPEFTARTWEMAGCAELVTTGARLAAIRAALASPPLALPLAIAG